MSKHIYPVGIRILYLVSVILFGGYSATCNLIGMTITFIVFAIMGIIDAHVNGTGWGEV